MVASQLKTRNRSASCAAVALLSAIVLASGCQGWPQSLRDPQIVPPADHPSETAKGPKAKPDKANTPIDPFKALVDENWVLAIAGPDDSTPPAHRWRLAALEEMLDRPRDKQPNWEQALVSDKQIVAVNAAIALARQAQGHPEETLVTAVHATPIKLAVRCASAEALGDVHTKEAVKSLHELLDQFGRFTGDARTHYTPEIHAELLRALSHQPGCEADTRFAHALKSPAPIVKREALEAMSKVSAKDQQDASLPPLASDLATDADGQVRIAALRLLIARQDPQASDKVARAVSDSDLTVRLAAIELLGEVKNPSAHDRLQRLAADHADLVREAAIRALAKAGDWDAVEAAAADTSWRVRKAVATSLASHVDRRSATLARQLLTDSSLSVQREVVSMTNKWPLEHAGPILLTAIEAPSYLTRKDAAAQLADRWPAAAGFPIDAPAARRSDLAGQLQEKWSAQFGNVSKDAIVDVPAAKEIISPERRTEVEKYLAILADRRASQIDQAAALQGLTNIGPELPAVLEACLSDHGPLPERVYHDVLPQCGKEFELTEQLASKDPRIRRSAIAALAKLSSEKTISTVALGRICALLTSEDDPTIWISAFKLIEHDPRESASLLAAAGLSHPSPEVRRRACGYFGAYPDPQRAEVLVAALTDENLPVLHSAVQALGEFPALADPTPVERQLGAADHSLRLDAAVTLARWKLESGREALERLSADGDSRIRRQTAQAIGKLRDSALLPALIAQLDDQQDIRRAALQSLRSLTGSDEPPGSSGERQASNSVIDSADQVSKPLAEQAQRWKDWYAQQETRR